MFFFSSKKALAVQTSFVLIILVLVGIALGSYFISKNYEINVNKLKIKIKEADLYYSFSKKLGSLMYQDNSSVNYSDSFFSSKYKIVINESNCSIIYDADNYYVITNYTLSVNFCDNYTLYPKYGGIFYFNGSCISLIS
jgi:hypothetical protein